MEYNFGGKYYYEMLEDNSSEAASWFLGIDGEHIQLKADAKDYERFNVYGDIDGQFVMQAMNGKYVIYDQEHGYRAIEEVRERGCLFSVQYVGNGSQGEKRYNLIHPNQEGNQLCLAIIEGVLSNKTWSAADASKDCCFVMKQLAHDMNYLLKFGAAVEDLTYADLHGQNFTFKNFSEAILDYADLSGCILKDITLATEKSSAQHTNFSNCNLSNALLTGAVFIGSNFNHSDLSNSVCNKAIFTDCSFDGCTLRGVQMNQANLKHITMQNADAYRCDFVQVDLSDSNLQGTDFTMGTFLEVALENTILDRTKMSSSALSTCKVNENTTFQYADLSKSSFKKMSLEHAAFTHAKLMQCEFNGTNMHNCDLSFADLTQVKCIPEDNKNVILVGATLANSNLTMADFTGAQFGTCGEYTEEKAADLTNAIMKDAVFDHANLYGVNMSGVSWYGQNASALQAQLQLINFTNANLSRMNFTGAKLNGCIFDSANLFEANFNQAVLAPVSNLRTVSFSKANLQSADFMDCEIRQAVFSNAAVGLNDGPYFPMPYNTEKYQQPTQSLNELKALLNTSGAIPMELYEVFEQAGYPLEENAALETDYTNYCWHIMNGSNKTYVRYNLYVAGDVIQVAGPTIGVPMFTIDSVTKETVEALDALSKQAATSSKPQELPQVIVDAFTNSGYELQDPLIAPNCQKGVKWLLQNMTQRGGELVEGYIEFNLKAVPAGNQYSIKVYGYTLATIRITEEQYQEQQITYINTTGLIQNNLSEDTICPDGQNCAMLYDERPTVRITWEQAMTASTLPKPPKVIPWW